MVPSVVAGSIPPPMEREDRQAYLTCINTLIPVIFSLPYSLGMDVEDDKLGSGGQTARTRQRPLRNMGRRLGTRAGERNAVGDRVRERRVSLGLTVDQVHAHLAEATDGRWNPSRQQIQHIEARRRAVTDLEVIALAAVLECGTSWLLEGEAADARPETRSPGRG